ncbi:MAG: hypothetical protein DRO98_03810 [Archaeoglobales archaeon]|nr:MAG: hypothetical protein DRO98_03810 [Archaeoglobales archaeon]
MGAPYLFIVKHRLGQFILAQMLKENSQTLTKRFQVFCNVREVKEKLLNSFFSIHSVNQA